MIIEDQLSFELTAAKAKLTQLKIELEKERLEKRNLRENLEKSSTRIAELEGEYEFFLSPRDPIIIIALFL